MTGKLSWGRFPHFEQLAEPVVWRCDVNTLILDAVRRGNETLAFGNGRSYGDSCYATSDKVIETRGLSRFIRADWSSGLVCVEAGMTIDELLQVCVPRGWFMPVSPGTKYATIGGALANDVHGKNHLHMGTFGSHIRSFALSRSDGELHICSMTENSDLFCASIGGLGLTGIVLWVEFQLKAIQSSLMNACSIRFDSLREFHDLSGKLDDANAYSVAWIDCVSGGNSLGRGIYSVGNHALDGPLEYDDRRKLSVPVTPPVSCVNALSLKTFNSLYFHRHPRHPKSFRQSYEPFFYPLDAMLHWNRIYGRSGFQQYQCVIPTGAAVDSINEILERISRSGRGSFLAVLKRFGDIKSPGWMSFPVPGLTLALDFPESRASNERLFQDLDGIVRLARGRLYPAKDAHMSGTDFRQAYPCWERVERLRDRALNSRFWKRVTTS